MTILLEMVSDIVCPWCWLGLRRVTTALETARAEGHDVNLRFRPFELDPDVPKEGVGYKEYMTRKFGGLGEAEADAQKDRFASMRTALETYGEEEGISFRFSDLDRRPNTFDAHRLLRWAQGQDRGHAAKEALFSAYFDELLDVGRHDVLVDIAGRIGLDKHVVAKLLAENADAEAVRREEEFFRGLGIGGVPTLIADRRIALQGAETPAKIVKLISAAAKTAMEERPTAG